ncbi:MAG: hypothetical protein F6K54_13860 [Okeania sp. SIO3B5]|uniref:hypothetical protein n=1 Tax=Okeania sp. SIO3B5 TaxID=2607811 RepID=UPI0013FEB332|nr:hypothetical protein [Okeania sp. SIO3B5]NEO54068.1 hypothetical protein [Okeania sp. SIO3B5]
MAREQDAPTGAPRNKNNATHDHYDVPPPIFFLLPFYLSKVLTSMHLREKFFVEF